MLKYIVSDLQAEEPSAILFSAMKLLMHLCIEPLKGEFSKQLHEFEIRSIESGIEQVREQGTLTAIGMLGLELLPDDRIFHLIQDELARCGNFLQLRRILEGHAFVDHIEHLFALGVEFRAHHPVAVFTQPRLSGLRLPY